MVRRLLSLAVISGLLAVTPVIGATAGTRQRTVCNVDMTATISPGLNLIERDQTLKGTGTADGCTGSTVTSATLILRARGHASCFSGTATGGALVTWDTGEESRIKVDLDVSQGILQGTVVSWLFAGEPVPGDLTIQPLQGDCFFRPVTKARAFGTITIG